MAAIFKRMLVLLAISAVVPASAGGATATVQTMVVGKNRTLVGPKAVRVPARTVRASGKPCALAAGTPLGALAATGISFAVRDQGACSSRARDSGGLYVFRIGPDRARAQDGWVYKVDGRAGSTSAGDAGGPFGTGRRLRSGQQVLWFWCRMGDRGCQASLDIHLTAEGRAVLVRAFDDAGRARPVGGATVTLADGTSLISDAAGRVTLPATVSDTTAVATAPGLVRSFPIPIKQRAAR